MVVVLLEVGELFVVAVSGDLQCLLGWEAEC